MTTPSRSTMSPQENPWTFVASLAGIGFPNYSHVGGFDELYIRKGVAAFTSNFTPPTAAYSPP